MSSQQLGITEESSIEFRKGKKQSSTFKNVKFKLYSLQKCQIHRAANSFGNPIQNSKLCQCCNRKYEKSTFSICFSNSQISVYGQGLTLYFQFLRMMIVLTGLILVTFAIPIMMLNYGGNACHQMMQLNCSRSIFIKLAAVNKLDNFKHGQLQSALSVLAILSVFICVQIYRKRFNDIQQEISYSAGPQKYGVFCNVYLRQGDSLKQDDILKSIKSWFKRQGKINREVFQKLETTEQVIQQVFISYDVHVGKQIKNRTQQLIELVQVQQDSNEIAQYKSQIQALKMRINNVQIKKNNKFLVIFKQQKVAKYFLQRTNQNRLQLICSRQNQNKYFYNQNLVQVYKAPLPSEILWQNHHIKGQQKIVKRCLVYLLSFVLLISGQSLIFLVLYSWFTQGDDSSSLSTYISGLVSAFITVINFILYEVFIIISKFQFRSISLQDKISKSIKIIISVCLNSGIMLLGAYFIVNLSTIWETNGFVDTISYTFIYAIFTPHIFKYVNLYNIFKLHSYFKIKNGNANLTQKMANLLFQRPQGFQCYHYYSWEITLIWMACFFGPIIPMTFVCVFVTFFIHYWLQKINYVYFYKEQKPWGSLLNKKMTDIVQVSQFLFALGNIVMEVILKTLRNESIQMGPLIVSINLIIFTAFHIFVLPKNSIIRLVTCWYCKQKQSLYQLSYQQAKNRFILSYQQQILNHFDKKMIKDIGLFRQDLLGNIQHLQSLIQMQQHNLERKGESRQNTQGELIQLQAAQIKNASMRVEDNPKKTNSLQKQTNIKNSIYFKTLRTIKQESEYSTINKYQNA